MISIMFLLALTAFVLTVAAATNHAPLWTAVLVLCLLELLRVVPLR